MSQSRLWTFTKQSDDETSITWMLASDDNLPIDNPDSQIVQCLYYQVEEAPTTHKIHLQGFIVTKKRSVFNTIKKLFPGCHIEKARGTQEQNVAYCSKSDTKILGPFIIGELEHPGKSTPLESCVDLVKKGSTFKQVCDEYPQVYVKHFRGLQALRFALLSEPPKWRTLEVVYIYGKTGVGKTRYCYELSPNLYKVVNNGQWWDGYYDQESILFDEFYGDIRVKDMLNWLDGYPIQLPIKGGFTYGRWIKVYITSNNPLESLYPTVPLDVREAFIRRITTVVNM